MTWIKICGITNLEDALIAVDAGADALGFVFYEKSPRRVSPEVVCEITTHLPAKIEKVGVFVGDYPEHWPDFVRNAGLTGTQLHFGLQAGSGSARAYGVGCFPPGFKQYLSIPADWVIQYEDRAKSFISSAAPAAESMRSASGGDDFFANFFQTIFLDSGSLRQPGGTGMVFDWRKAAPMVEHMKETVRVVIAGGLNPANVGEAIRILKPWGVDVASGVEAKPGKKDPEKVRAFITAVRQAERSA